jgi:hypothetical protein
VGGPRHECRMPACLLERDFQRAGAAEHDVPVLDVVPEANVEYVGNAAGWTTHCATTSSNILSQLGRPNTVADFKPLMGSGLFAALTLRDSSM